MMNKEKYRRAIPIGIFLGLSLMGAGGCMVSGPMIRMSEDKVYHERFDSVLLVRLRIHHTHQNTDNPVLYPPVLTFVSFQENQYHDIDCPAKKWKHTESGSVFDELLAVQLVHGKYKMIGLDMPTPFGKTGFRSPYTFEVPEKSVTYFGQYEFEIGDGNKYVSRVAQDTATMAEDVKLFADNFPGTFQPLKNNTIAATPQHQPELP